MLKIKFSEKNTIFVILNKNKKNINFNLGEYLNSNTSYYKNKLNKLIIYNLIKFKKIKYNDFSKLDNFFDYSILNNISEKNLWNNPELISLLKCIALEDILKKKKIDKIILDIIDYNIFFFLRNIFSKKKIEFKGKKKINYKLKTNENSCYLFLSSINNFFKKFISELNFSKKKLNSISNQNLFITYSTIIKKNQIDDFFWKNLSFNNYKKSTKLIINVDNYTDKKKLNLIHAANLKKNNYEFIESYQTFSILFKSLFQWIRLLLIFRTFYKSQIKNPFFALYIKRSIISFSFLKDINLINLLSRYFKIKNFKNVNYLFENLNWEKGLNKILKRKAKLKAYQHTSVREWDLRYCPSANELQIFKDYLPDEIYSNSTISRTELKKYFLKSKIYKTKNSRYSYRNKNYKKDKVYANRILIIGDISMNETMDIANLFLRNIDNKFKLDLKLHPINADKDIKIKKLKIISNNNLNKVIKNYKFIICSNSTTSIYEVLKNKKIPFVYLNKNNLNLCPVKKMENINYITSDLSVKKLIKDKYKRNFNFEKFSKTYV